MITMAFDPDLDDCVVIALRQMLDLICARAGLDRYQAYTLASLAADLRVTQVVNGNKDARQALSDALSVKPPPSCPRLSRASTPSCWTKDVDARDKPAHDGGVSRSICAELDDVGDLLVFRIDDDDLLVGNEKPVALHLRHLLCNLAGHRL
jgi:hypothetical protein